MAVKKLKEPNYEKLGRLLVSIGELGVKDRKHLYRIEFFRGIVRGLGGAIGATFVLSLLLLIFSLLGQVPLIGDVIQIVKDSLPNV